MTAAAETYELDSESAQPAGARAGPAGAVEKSFVVLETVAAAARPLGVSELARQTGLPKSTVHRILAILVDFGLVRRGKDGYQPGRRLTQPAAKPADRWRQLLRERTVPFLLDLYELTHETVQLGVLCGPDVVYLDKLHGRRSAAIRVSAGPATANAMGRVLLAYSPLEAQGRYLRDGARPGRAAAAATSELEAELSRIRYQGISTGQDEPVRGTRSVAAPILGPERLAVAAIAVTGTTNRIDSQVVLALRRAAYEAAQAVRGIPAGRPEADRAHSNGPYSNGPYSNGPYSNGPYSNGRSAAIARSVTSSTGPVASMPSKIPFSA
jgi:DNA-binding IclR family transcriptional regulator